MVIGGITYNNHFRHMILSGLLAGLTHPIEFIVNYEKGIGEKRENMYEIEKFCSLAIRKFYSVMFCDELEDITEEMCLKWVNTYYNTKEKE
ncbi:MAG: hypothetical protein AABY22_18355 [Nanoarchaeota archaeon]